MLYIKLKMINRSYKYGLLSKISSFYLEDDHKEPQIAEVVRRVSRAGGMFVCWLYVVADKDVG